MISVQGLLSKDYRLKIFIEKICIKKICVKKSALLSRRYDDTEPSAAVCSIHDNGLTR